jgi:anti-sigma regulatory factor (Ser/Thr protein kinase)
VTAGTWPAPRGRRLALAAAGPADLAAVRAHVAAACDDAGADAELRDALVLATDELCANVVLHAYPAGPGPLTVDAAVDDGPDPPARCYRITVIDAGAPFDPTTAAAPDVTLGAEDRAVGGLGLLFVRRSVDAVHYARVGGHNVVTLEKHPSHSRPAAP